MKPALCLITLTATLTLAPRAVPQQAVPPPPRPADAGPTLAVTTAFIQDKLNDIGEVTFTVLFDNEPGGFSANYKITQAATAGCQVTYRRAWNGKADSLSPDKADVTTSFDMASAQDVIVLPMEQQYDHMMTRAGGKKHTATSTTPALTVLVVRSQHHREDWFPFDDPGMADRMAKAFVHAIELCGGGNKDPF